MEKFKKIYRIISLIVFYLIVTLSVILYGLKIFSFSPYIVLSGSMEPKFPVGSLVYVKKTSPSNIKIGDAITFIMKDSHIIITHEVVEVDIKNESYFTKGVANKTRDNSPVLYKNVIGKVYFCVPYIGYISKAISTPRGLLFVLVTTVAWFIILCITQIRNYNLTRK